MKATLGVRPHDVVIESGGSARDGGAALAVTLVEALGTESFVHGTLGGGPFIARLDAAAQVKKGDLLPLTCKAVHLFEPESGQSLRRS
jgi:sn-glycerol 3-phosphate transport system ATP-binding protein/multiple sugar transport system ATP-binding protein